MLDSLSSVFKNKEKILFLKKKEYDIYYNCKYKYPILTVGFINENTGKTNNTQKIYRKDIEDPFKEDKNIPEQYRMSNKDYTKYMEYGGSLGHNEPASHHKTNLSIYNETFLFSNISPQEIVFNTGLWIVLETWTKRLQNEPDLTDITVFTGNIPAKQMSDLNGLKINVPTHMYKLVACKHNKYPDRFYIACFLMKNEPPSDKKHKIFKHLVSLKDLSKIANINFFILFSLYMKFNPTTYKISSMNKIVRLDIKFNSMLAKQMISSLYYGKIIYSTSLSKLEQNWDAAKKSGFDDEFHEIYYDLAEKRLTRELKESKSKKGSKKSSREHSKKSSRENSKKSSREHSKKSSRENSKKSSREHSKKSSREHSKKSSRENSKKGSKKGSTKGSKKNSTK
jgi:DNA/RNA endonuclease G (NUC1)